MVIASRKTNLRCLTLPERETVVVRPSGGVQDEAEGEVIRLEIAKEWTYAKQRYLSGKVVESWIDGEVLAPVPLGLRDMFTWDPKGEFLDAWRDQIRGTRRHKPGKPVGDSTAKRRAHLTIVPPPPAPDWVMEIIDSGKRSGYEMEQMLPEGLVPEASPGDFDDDPIVYAAEHFRGGDYGAAFEILQKCLQVDTRCIDAYVHLGLMLVGDLEWEWAHVVVPGGLKRYQAAVAIGERSLPPGFDGVLSWNCIDNRPFLRALHGLGLCHWRLGDLPQAHAIFKRILRLNPNDNQGIRFLLPYVESDVRYLEYRKIDKTRVFINK